MDIDDKIDRAFRLAKMGVWPKGRNGHKNISTDAFYTASEIADLSGLSTNTIFAIEIRALNKIKTRLEKEHAKLGRK